MQTDTVHVSSTGFRRFFTVKETRDGFSTFSPITLAVVTWSSQQAGTVRLHPVASMRRAHACSSLPSCSLAIHQQLEVWYNRMLCSEQ
jgi:hypothetical protein